MKDAKFIFDEQCHESFELLKRALISAPIMQPLDWNLPFEIMCDASDYVVGAVLGQRKDKKLHAIYYASRTLDEAQKALSVPVTPNLPHSLIKIIKLISHQI